MLVALYVGGKLTKGVEGVYYSKDASFGLQVNERTTFIELKQLVYEKTGVNPNRYDLDLATRIDTQRAGAGRPYFVSFPITDEELWKAVYQQFESRGVAMIDLYSRRVMMVQNSKCNYDRDPDG